MATNNSDPHRPTAGQPERSQPEETGLFEGSLFTAEQRSELLRTCAASMLEQANRLAEALRKKDRPAFHDAVHALHGTAAVYGFNQVAGAAGLLEHQLDEGKEFEPLRAAALELVELCQQTARPWLGGPVSE
jgi:HPt (histidine-containing phosphotransfer) domain-containing protein